MIKNISFIVCGFAIGISIATAFAKYESSSNDAWSVVGYGKNGTTLVPILVDADGVVQAN